MTTSTTPDRFTLGYRSAEQFYGRGARYALDEILAELARFRGAFPKLPAQVEPYIDRIERLARQDDQLRGDARDHGAVPAPADTQPEGLASIRAALEANSANLFDALAATIAFLGAQPEWSMDINFDTTEWVASLPARYGLPSASGQTPEALSFYRAAALDAGYTSDEFGLDEEADA